MRLSAAAALGAILLLAACTPEEPPATLPSEDACGASGLQGLLGQPVADQDFAGFGATRRIMQDGSPMTMDYRADRLNVTYDGGGRITRIWCG
ncbi:MAG: I78 family peptidase inhibitor [Paracoccaceae bacterium]|jgi:hypothetical protein|nr:I78 family peptidase inhibitor [Paracoccaceae bacterium]